ncbi:hypothetical protein [Thermogemmatispora sp.]|nr:hypothetical protein [Thermogemmatispora sp.]
MAASSKEDRQLQPFARERLGNVMDRYGTLSHAFALALAGLEDR